MRRDHLAGGLVQAVLPSASAPFAIALGSPLSFSSVFSRQDDIVGVSSSGRIPETRSDWRHGKIALGTRPVEEQRYLIQSPGTAIRKRTTTGFQDSTV